MPGYNTSPAGGPGGRGFHGPGSPSLLAGTVSCSSGRLRERVECCHAAVIASAQGQVAWIFAAPPPAAHQRGRRQDPVTQLILGSAVAKSPSRASSLSQASRDRGDQAAVSQAALTVPSAALLAAQNGIRTEDSRPGSARPRKQRSREVQTLFTQPQRAPFVLTRPERPVYLGGSRFSALREVSSVQLGQAFPVY